MGKEDARRGCVSWLVEPLYGNRLARLVQSTHHQGAQALATTHRLSLGALVTPGAWSVATMHTALARSEFASCRTRRVRAYLVRRVHRLWCPVLQKHLLPRTVLFFKPSSSFHQLVGFYPQNKGCHPDLCVKRSLPRGQVFWNEAGRNEFILLLLGSAYPILNSVR